MTMLQVEDFRQHGYVVIDNFISREAAMRIKAEALRLSHKGVQEPFASLELAAELQHVAPEPWRGIARYGRTL